MTEKRTAGEWVAKPAVRQGYVIETDVDIIVATEDVEGRYGTIENGADARLMAAAPDMYEALALTLSHLIVLGGDPDDSDSADGIQRFVITRARAALQKAVPDAAD